MEHLDRLARARRACLPRATVVVPLPRRCSCGGRSSPRCRSVRSAWSRVSRSALTRRSRVGVANRTVERDPVLSRAAVEPLRCSRTPLGGAPPAHVAFGPSRGGVSEGDVNHTTRSRPAAVCDLQRDHPPAPRPLRPRGDHGEDDHATQLRRLLSRGHLSRPAAARRSERHATSSRTQWARSSEMRSRTSPVAP